jgi:aminoglycoside phosphotransferase (APT) family kinase protein
MEILSKHISLAIPKYEWIAQDQSFAGYRIIGGKPLSASRFHRNLDQRIRTSIASELAQFLSEMHSVSCQEVTDLGFPLMDRHESFQSFYHNFKMHVNPRLNQTEQNVAEKYFSELEKVSTSKFRRVVTHRDLLPDHIFIRNDLKGLSGIIDFSDAGVDDPAIDFAGLWAYGKKFVTAVFEQYKDALDSSLLHRSMIYSLRIPFWMMLDPFMYGRGDFNKGYTEFHKRVVRISQKALLQGWYESI